MCCEPVHLVVSETFQSPLTSVWNVQSVKMSQRRGIRVLLVLMPFILLQLSDYAFANIDNQHYMPPLECYDPYGRPQVRIESNISWN